MKWGQGLHTFASNWGGAGGSSSVSEWDTVVPVEVVDYVWLKCLFCFFRQLEIGEGLHTCTSAWGGAGVCRGTEAKVDLL